MWSLLFITASSKIESNTFLIYNILSKKNITREGVTTVKVYRKLTFQERCLIKIGIDARKSRRAIAESIGRHASVVCSEIKKNGGCLWYDPKAADEKRRLSARKGTSKIENHEELREYIMEKLREK